MLDGKTSYVVEPIRVIKSLVKKEVDVVGTVADVYVDSVASCIKDDVAT